MIKKSVFEEELMLGMDRELRSMGSEHKADDLVQAADYLHSAMELLEDTEFTVQAEEIFQILEKIAVKHKHKIPQKTNGHTKGLTPEKMLKNLKEHGWVFNLADDGSINDFLNAEIGEELEVGKKDTEGLDFEDEI